VRKRAVGRAIPHSTRPYTERSSQEIRDVTALSTVDRIWRAVCSRMRQMHMRGDGTGWRFVHTTSRHPLRSLPSRRRSPPPRRRP